MQRSAQSLRKQFLLKKVCCPFVSDETGEESDFPQMSGVSCAASFKEAYLKCMVALFASYRRFDGTSKCALITNVDPARYCSASIRAALERLEVEIAIVPFDPSKRTKTGKFGNVLYMIDAVEHVFKNDPDDLFMFLDPDCVFVSDPEVVWDEIAAKGVSFYDVGSHCDEDIAGLSLDKIRRFAVTSGLAIRSDLRHAGGEFLGITREAIPGLLATIADIRARDVGGTFVVEEHYLSLAAAMRLSDGAAFNRRIRRIWTGPRRKNACQQDLDLTIWHVPREKEFGLSDLYRDLSRKPGIGLGDMPQGRYLAYLSSRLGIPRWSSTKWATDMPRVISRKLARRRSPVRG